MDRNTIIEECAKALEGLGTDTRLDDPDDAADCVKAAAISTVRALQVHDSDCALHNMPAMPNGPCDCSLSGRPQSPSLVLVTLHQYRDDMRYPPSADSRERRIEMIDRAIAQASK